MTFRVLVHANDPVSKERLIDALWGEAPPPTAARSLHNHVSALRKALGDGRIVTEAGGYRLVVADDELDAARFDALAEQGAAALATDDPDRAADLLREALALWRGPAFGDLAHETVMSGYAASLDERRLSVLEDRIDADLALGRHGPLVAELERLVTQHPLRERLRGQQMLALYRSGRQADALAAYADARRYLVDELGIEPGPALRELERAVLEHDPALGAPRELPSPLRKDPIARRFMPRLPTPVSSLVGRDQDPDAVADLLRRPNVRLVSLTGPGGVGKTTVAIELAHRLVADFADGAAFVELAPLQDAEHVPVTIVHALGGTIEAGATPVEVLTQLLAGRDQLVVLDNFEHLLAASPLLAELLDAALGLKLLVTSRAALELRAEHRYLLDPLGLPVDGSTVAHVTSAPASALFIERATAQDRSFAVSADNAAAIAMVCERAAGLPLAIELTAARCAVMSPQEIARALDPILPALGAARRDAPARHRTLRATLDWSYGLLEERERVGFARLSVFAGGCTLDAAEQVAGATLEVVDRLIAHSMLYRRAGRHGDTRLVMLEPIREYAAERLLERSDATDTGERHSRYHLQLAEVAREALRGHGQLLWQRRLDAEADNLRRALAREGKRGNHEAVVRLASAVENWWTHAGFGAEGHRWIKEALAAAAGNLPAGVEADALRVIAHLGVDQAELEHSLSCARRAVELFRQLDDPDGTALALIQLGFLQLALDQADQAQATAAEALGVARGASEWTLASAHLMRTLATSDLATARQTAADAAARLERVGDVRALTDLWNNLGYTALSEGALTEADQFFHQALALARHSESPIDRAYIIGNLGLVALDEADRLTAAARFSETLALCRSYGIRRPVSEALAGLSAIAAAAGDGMRAAELAGASAATRFGAPWNLIDQRLHASILETRRDGDQDAWEAAYAAGSGLQLHEAIDLGLAAAAAEIERSAETPATP
jgi:predicted ATPase/DNA-binding SARP family transcriptional activator/Tfp pilus assembly protein PilF